MSEMGLALALAVLICIGTFAIFYAPFHLVDAWRWRVFWRRERELDLEHVARLRAMDRAAEAKLR